MVIPTLNLISFCKREIPNYFHIFFLQLLCHSGVENMQVTLACQATQKNALMVAVQQASFYHTPRGSCPAIKVSGKRSLGHATATVRPPHSPSIPLPLPHFDTPPYFLSSHPSISLLPFLPF